jgi:hypothetical protein
MEYWEPTMAAIQCVVDCLPKATQDKIVERLHLLARVQMDRGMLEAAYYTQTLSGGPPASEVLGLGQTPGPVLRLVVNNT